MGWIDPAQTSFLQLISKMDINKVTLVQKKQTHLPLPALSPMAVP